MTTDSDPATPISTAALRADIRRLGMLLGQTLARQEGQALLDLVEEVRALVRTDGAAAARRLAGVDVTTATQLARAFSTYFHLANITEQVHRARGLRRRRARRGRLAGPGRPADRRARRPGRRGRGGGRPPRGPAGVHRPPDRGGPPVDPGQAARGRRRARRRGRRAALDGDGRGRVRPGRPAAGRAHRPAVADRRAAADPTRPDATRRATPSTTCATSPPTRRPKVLADLADTLRGLGRGAAAGRPAR